MPLGAFRQNTLAKYLAPSGPVVEPASDWGAFTWSNVTNKYVVSSSYYNGRIVPMDGINGLIVHWDGFSPSSIKGLPYTRNGSALSFGTELTQSVTTSYGRGDTGCTVAVKSGDYAVVANQYATAFNLALWSGGSSFTWQGEQVLSGLSNITSGLSYSLNDTVIVTFGSIGSDTVLRFFSRSGSTITHQGDVATTLINNGNSESSVGVIPLQAANQFIVHSTDLTADVSQAVVVTINPDAFTFSEEDLSPQLSGTYHNDVNANQLVGPTTINEEQGSHGIQGFVNNSNYEFVDLVPTNFDGTTLTPYTGNRLQLRSNIAVTNFVKRHDTLKINSEWFLVHHLYFGATDGFQWSRLFTLVKYNASNNTLTKGAEVKLGPRTYRLWDYKVFMVQLDNDHLMIMSNEDTDSNTAKVYVVPRV